MKKKDGTVAEITDTVYSPLSHFLMFPNNANTQKIQLKLCDDQEMKRLNSEFKNYNK